MTGIVLKVPSCGAATNAGLVFVADVIDVLIDKLLQCLDPICPILHNGFLLCLSSALLRFGTLCAALVHRILYLVC
jgi:hypothetical protein